MKEKINLKEIAKLCDVSVATVSRVLNENGRYSQETAEKVHEVIKQYGYRPNQIAKGLRTNKVEAVGVIVPDITNEFFSGMVLAMQEHLFQKGYSCIIFNTNESEDIEQQCIANLMSLNIGGIISVNSRLDLEKLLNIGVPVVCVDRQEEERSEGTHHVFISSDHRQGAYLAGKELAECGCKVVACITALENASVTHMRNAGFNQACEEYGMELPEEMVFCPRQVSLQAGYELAEQILAGKERPDGIFCQSDWLAIGALNAILDHGIKVPEELQIVGFDDIRASRITRVPLTTVHQPSQELGLRTAELVLQMIHGSVPEEKSVLLPVELMRRKSTKSRL